MECQGIGYVIVVPAVNRIGLMMMHISFRISVGPKRKIGRVITINDRTTVTVYISPILSCSDYEFYF